MKSEVLVSIIIPVYNAKDKLNDLLKSVRENTNSDIEFIFVDDGSNDGSNDFILEKTENIINVTVISQENRGPGGARNTGLLHASGEYVWFVDADDDIFLSVVDKVRKHAHENYDFFDFNIIEKGLAKNTMILSPGTYGVNDSIPIDFYKMMGRLWSKIISRDFLVANSIYYPENCIYEDNYLIFLIPLYVSKFMKLDDVSYKHHQNCESITRSEISESFFDRVLTADRGYSFYLANSTLGDEIDRVISGRYKIILLGTLSKIISGCKFKILKHAIYTCKVYKNTADKNRKLLRPFVVYQNPRECGFIKSIIINRLMFLSQFTKRTNAIDFFYECNERVWKGKTIKFRK